MKTLLLLRHAKTAKSDPFVSDHDRPLTPRGEEDAALMGAHLRVQKLVPDRVLCSTALRAYRTWEIAATELGGKPSVERLRELYQASLGGIAETIRRSAEPSRVLLVVGHNPGLQSLAVSLAGSGAPDAIVAQREKFPTAALVVIQFEINDWGEMAAAQGALDRFVRPKDLKL